MPQQTLVHEGSDQDHPLLEPVRTHATHWDPSTVRVSMAAKLDACLVPSTAGLRADTASVVVLDNFIDEPTRCALLEAITAPGWEAAADAQPQTPLPDNWERSTSDSAGAPRTWGLTAESLQRLQASHLPAKLEVHSRLSKLYPELIWCHQPSAAIQVQAAGATGSEATDGGEQNDHSPEVATTVYDATNILANAACAGDEFQWHQDADPQTFPDSSAWVQRYGHYTNREPGYPHFVSLILYLNKEWHRDWAAVTHVLDTSTGTGLIVEPKPYRAVLMDQDVVHRLSPPSRAAGGRRRFSLVWKLVAVPQPYASAPKGNQLSILQPGWPCTSLGSAAKMEATVMALARKRKAVSQGQQEAETQ